MKFTEKQIIVKSFNEKRYKEGYFVTIELGGHFAEPEHTRPYVINWSAIGDTDIETTKEFIKQLKDAVELVEMLNEDLEVQ